MTIRRLLAMAVCVLSIYACTETIDLDTTGVETSIVVAGEVTNSEGPHEIKIKNSALFAAGTNGAETVVTGADVRIVENGSMTYNLVETEPGTYTTAAGDLCGEIGNSYQLQITLNGKTYQSLNEKINPVPTVNNLTWELIDKQFVNESGNISARKFMQVRASTDFSDFQDDVYLTWWAGGEYEFVEAAAQGNLNPLTCYIKQTIDINNLVVVNGQEVAGRSLVDQPIIDHEFDYKFRDKYCFKIYQKSLSKSGFQFWNNVKSELNRSGDLYETPPAKIKGNLVNVDDSEEQVLGYFFASAVDTSRIFILPSELPVNVPNVCGFPRPSKCTNCLLEAENATLTRPPYWE